MRKCWNRDKTRNNNRRRIINNLRYADDTALYSGNLDDLKILINAVKETSEKAGLRLNIKKAKVMTTTGL